jgi:hypothetical protein
MDERHDMLEVHSSVHEAFVERKFVVYCSGKKFPFMTHDERHRIPERR